MVRSFHWHCKAFVLGIWRKHCFCLYVSVSASLLLISFLPFHVRAKCGGLVRKTYMTSKNPYRAGAAVRSAALPWLLFAESIILIQSRPHRHENFRGAYTLLDGLMG